MSIDLMSLLTPDRKHKVHYDDDAIATILFTPSKVPESEPGPLIASWSFCPLKTLWTWIQKRR